MLLKISNERPYRLLVESIQDYGIFLLDPLGYIQIWNEGACRIIGYSTEEILGKHFSLFYPEDETSSRKPAGELEIAIQQGGYEEEGWRVRKDQTRFWAKDIINPVYDEEKQLIGFSKVIRDLTDRKKYENSLLTREREKHQYNQLLLTAFDNSPAGMVLFEAIKKSDGEVIDFKYKLTNRANAATAGRTVEELGDNSLHTLFPDITQQLWQQLVTCYQTGLPQQHTENYTGDDLDIWIDGMFLKQGEDVLWIFQDITGLKRVQMELEKELLNLHEEKRKVEIDLGRLMVAEKEIVRALERERETNMLKTEFVNLVSHQFRTPMTSILLKAEAIKRFSERSTDQAFAQKVVECSEQISRDIHQLNKLISEVLIHERMQLGQVTIRSKPLNLAKFFQNFINQQRQYNPDYQRIVLHTNTKNAVVLADATLLEQVLENLINNALKYSIESEKVVEVTLNETADECIVVVKDYGIGIPADDIKYVTKSFYRASNTTHYPGTGLGLSLSNRLIEMHGGQLAIESNENQYTIFTITLPNQKEETLST